MFSFVCFLRRVARDLRVGLVGIKRRGQVAKEGGQLGGLVLDFRRPLRKDHDVLGVKSHGPCGSGDRGIGVNGVVDVMESRPVEVVDRGGENGRDGRLDRPLGGCGIVAAGGAEGDGG